MSRIDAVVFDMDGTLIDTEKLNVRFWCEASSRFGFDMDPNDIVYIRSLDPRRSAEYLGSRYPGFVFDDVREVRRELMQNHVDRFGIEPKPGVIDVLSYLRDKGVKTAVATGTKQERADRYLGMIGASGLIDEIVSTSKVEHGKPEPDVYLYVCRSLGVRPEDTVAVEDAPFGIMSAYRAGCRVAMVPDLTPPDSEIEGMLTWTCDSLSDIADVVENETSRDAKASSSGLSECRNMCRLLILLSYHGANGYRKP
ncbi:MAG: HAD family phosphatase [Candidatus Methanomethylophilaceae archaeon]|nr:HAD family phosphatase [Candidatus Methanomethylophilaceae archaeon]